MKYIANLLEKLKEVFREKEFLVIGEFEFNRESLKFYKLDEETILDLSNYIKENLNESEKLGDKKNSLMENEAFQCKSLNEVLKFLKEAIEFDYLESAEESKIENWSFEYFVNSYYLNENTICVYNRLISNDDSMGNVIYCLVSIRKYDGDFYCWNHLEGFTASS